MAKGMLSKFRAVPFGNGPFLCLAGSLSHQEVHVMADGKSTSPRRINLADLNFTSYRISSSNCLSDAIGLPLDLALVVIRAMLSDSENHDEELMLLEHQIKDALRVAEKCQCQVEERGAS